MFRILTVLAAILLLGAAFAYLAEYPLPFVLSLPGWRVSFTPAAALAAALLFLLALALIVSLLRFLLAPLAWRSAWRRHKRANAYQNLSESLLAGFAGDAITAEQKQALSAGALPVSKEPLSALALAQISRLQAEEAALLAAEPQESAAAAEKLWLPLAQESRAKSGKTAQSSAELRLLAFKMLHSQAAARQDASAAAEFATAAAQISPSCLWASLAAASAKAAAGDWPAAEQIFAAFTRTRAKQIKKDRSGRLEHSINLYRQTLLCGQAAALFAHQPRQARDTALEAHKTDRDFAPAAVLAAEILYQLEETRKAEKLVLAAWRRAPHPDLAQCYIRGGGTVKNRAKHWARAQKLLEQTPGNAIALAQAAKAAYQAADYDSAQKLAEQTAAAAPTKQIFILLAELAARKNETAAASRFLAQALAAAAEKAWCADGQALAVWQPLSPISRQLAACRWQTPADGALYAETELQTLSAALVSGPYKEQETDEEAEKSKRGKKPKTGENAPLHGFAPLPAAGAAPQDPIHLNVDNPGVKPAKDG